MWSWTPPLQLSRSERRFGTLPTNELLRTWVRQRYRNSEGNAAHRTVLRTRFPRATQVYSPSKNAYSAFRAGTTFQEFDHQEILRRAFSFLL